MTLIEALIAAAVLAVVMWLLAGAYAEMLDRARRDQAERLIRTLGTGLEAYRQACDAYPPGRPDGNVQLAIEALLRVPQSNELLALIEVKLLHAHHGRPECHDPWGRQLRYLTERHESPALRERVRRTDGQPFFESAGSDGRFGDLDPTAATDDVAGDAPGV